MIGQGRSILAPIGNQSHADAANFHAPWHVITGCAAWRMHQFFNDTCNQRVFYSQRWRLIDYRITEAPRRVARHVDVWTSTVLKLLDQLFSSPFLFLVSFSSSSSSFSSLFLLDFFFWDRDRSEAKKKLLLVRQKKITKFSHDSNCLARRFAQRTENGLKLNVLSKCLQREITKHSLDNRENPFGEEQLFLNNTEVLYASHFNESRPTKLIVHGFSDTGNEGWIRDLIDGGWNQVYIASSYSLSLFLS